MTDLQDKNACLRAKIVQVLEKYPKELQDQNDYAINQASYGDRRPGDPHKKLEQEESAFCDEEQAYLQLRARAIIKLGPDLEAHFEGLLA